LGFGFEVLCDRHHYPNQYFRGGIPKRAIAEGILTPLGIEGDAPRIPKFTVVRNRGSAHDGGKTHRLSRRARLPAVLRRYGENLTTRGWTAVSCGWTALSTGTALIELTEIRVPCSTQDIYGAGLMREFMTPR